MKCLRGQMIDKILDLIETWSGKINSWAWNKRWRTKKDYGYRNEKR